MPGGEHAAGNVNVTGLEGRLVPRSLTARAVSVYVPGGTAVKMKLSVAGSVSDVDSEPLTSRTMLVGVPPVVPFCHARTIVEPEPTPSRFVGAEGGAGTLTKMRISFDASDRAVPFYACTRT